MSEQYAPDEMPDESATRVPAEAVDDSRLHDMGGDIGPASIRASSADDGSGSAEDAAPHEGYAREVPDSTIGADAPRDSPVSGSDQSGDIAPAPVAGAPSEYISIDDADNLGRGADGDTAAREAQRDL